MNTIRAQILLARTICEALNPHMNDVQVGDYIFFRVFGAYRGTEADRRHMALCQ
jgi:hypothetical protein